jgi:DNA-directed RNA polymerase specialized sigma24 family protein
MQKPSEEQIALVKKVRLRHHAELFNYVIGLLRRTTVAGNPKLIAEEILQNLYLNLLRYTPSGPIKLLIGYLKVSARNEFLRYVTQEKKDQFWHMEPGDQVVQNVACPEPPDIFEAFEKAMEQLPPLEQQVHEMLAEGMRKSAIAKALGIPPSAVTEARARLRKLINVVIYGRVRK